MRPDEDPSTEMLSAVGSCDLHMGNGNPKLNETFPNAGIGQMERLVTCFQGVFREQKTLSVYFVD